MLGYRVRNTRKWVGDGKLVGIWKAGAEKVARMVLKIKGDR